MDATGNFVVVWVSDPDGNSDIRVRRFDAAGNPIADGVQVNSFTPGAQRFPSVDMNPSGAFVVTWDSDSQDGLGYGVFAMQFDATGVAVAKEFQVNSYVTVNQTFPSVGLDDQGNFVIAWESDHDGDVLGIFARRFDSAGLGQATEFQVNAVTALRQSGADVDLDAEGDFGVVWTSTHEPMYGVFGQRFSSARRHG